jgi:hypothetical protein
MFRDEKTTPVEVLKTMVKDGMSLTMLKTDRLISEFFGMKFQQRSLQYPRIKCIDERKRGMTEYENLMYKATTDRP